ncbi:hypothetical protein [Streptomyces sp. NPDC127108]|uniref:hypothetical protein n=1 Tax=Streptomyces sp. NPDC127108 TaxID=3345361 RepID=UPI00362AAF9C
MRQRQTDHRGHERREGRDEPRHRSAARSPSPLPRTAEGMTPAGVRAMADAAGNGAVSRVLSVQRAGEGSGSGKRSRKGASRRDDKAVLKDIKTEVDGPPLVNYGARRQGRAHEEFWMRFPRFKDGEEAEETLHETSALLFDSMKGAQERAKQEDPDRDAEDANNREVQGMLINDRLLFASNFNSSVDTLVSQGRQVYGKEPTLQELLAFQQSDSGHRRGMHPHEAANLQRKLASYRRKNAAIVSGQRGAGEQGRGEDATALTLRAQLNAPVTVVDIEDKKLNSYITSPKYSGRVFLLRFAALDPRAKKQGKYIGQPTQEESLHAEQKLLLALSRAGISPGQAVTRPLAIMGKYRPCMGCAAALMYYRNEMGFGNLRFDENYGHYFQGAVGSVSDHLKHIMDDDYLKYIRQMVHNDITSTPAMAHEAAPAQAVHRNGGPSLRVPGRLASRHADVTPSASDAEFDEANTYTRVSRPLEKTWSEETAPAGIGKGKATHTAPRRRTDELTEAQAQQLYVLWNGRNGVHATNEDRRQAIELMSRYRTTAMMTLKHLGKAIDLSEGKLGLYLTEYEEKGHKTHMPQRSNKAPKSDAPKSRKKGAVDKQFPKGIPLDRAAKDTIKATIRGLSGYDWCADWERLHAGRSGSDLNPIKAPLDLLATLARLRRDGHYSVPEMSAYLHTGSNGDNLRKAIRRKGLDRLAELEGDSAAASSPQADQYAAPSPAQTDHYQAGSSSQADYYAPGSSSQAGYGGESSAAGAGYAPQAPEVPGFTLHLDTLGQAIYIEDDTGHHYIRVGGRMVRFQTTADEDVQMGGF